MKVTIYSYTERFSWGPYDSNLDAKSSIDSIVDYFKDNGYLSKDSTSKGLFIKPNKNNTITVINSNGDKVWDIEFKA